MSVSERYARLDEELASLEELVESELPELPRFEALSDIDDALSDFADVKIRPPRLRKEEPADDTLVGSPSPSIPPIDTAPKSRPPSAPPPRPSSIPPAAEAKKIPSLGESTGGAKIPSLAPPPQDEDESTTLFARENLDLESIPPAPADDVDAELDAMLADDDDDDDIELLVGDSFEEIDLDAMEDIDDLDVEEIDDAVELETGEFEPIEDDDGFFKKIFG